MALVWAECHAAWLGVLTYVEGSCRGLLEKQFAAGSSMRSFPVLDLSLSALLINTQVAYHTSAPRFRLPRVRRLVTYH